MLLVLHVMSLCGTDSNIYSTIGDGCILRKRERKKGEFSIKICQIQTFRKVHIRAAMGCSGNT